MWLPFLLSLPWVAVILFVLLRVRLPVELPPAGPLPEAASPEARAVSPEGPPEVSVVIPARDEASNIRRVLGSVAASEGVSFEVVVVDDRSGDGTGELARSVAAGNAHRIVVVDGEPLPDGWLGKPWACRQGAAVARGRLLLFTDADTVHGPDLLHRTVAALRDEGADAVTVVGRQLMESFWEKLVQPQIFLSMVFRFPDLSRPIPPRRWRSAIANGQYLLFRRESYDALGPEGGHGAVRDAVVEDLRLAQLLVRDGWSFRIRRAEDAFATRMYRSLAELVEGWSKNVVPGGLQTLPPLLRPIAPPLMVLGGPLLWLAPPLALGAALVGAGPPWVLPWAAAVTTSSALFWAAVTRRFRASWPYGLLYPLGTVVATWILLKSWSASLRGTVRWKGREYRGVGAGG